MNKPSRLVLALFVTLFCLLALLVAAYHVGDAPGWVILMDHDGPEGVVGGLLAFVIVSVVMLVVGVVLTVVFTGVGLLLLCVGLGVAALLLALAVPVLLPVVAILAVPFMILYGLFRLATKSQRAQSVA